MQTQKLNLARSWRSKQFSEIVGQDIVVKILQNSLYGNQIFPVYLLSGQRGCGKTSTARVFSAALNCEELPSFQNNPQSIALPCLKCASCKAMAQGKHPDFVEIDAASYTGVDNIRGIIDTSSFLPLLGKRKIYLIDEAHMLSKAAFNAFLKILEEPPPFVVFMLATTDSHKILDTVKSRSFQLFFDPIDSQDVVAHLEKICAEEKIVAEREALALIAQETEGSLRDAINLLEQVKFIGKKIHVSAVYQVLGHLEEKKLLDLLAMILRGDVKKVLEVASVLMRESLNPEQVWKQLVYGLYDVIAAYYKTPTQVYAVQAVEALAQVTSIKQLLKLFDKVCLYEEVLHKSTAKKITFQTGLLQLVYMQTLIQSNFSGSSSSGAIQSAPNVEQNSIELDDEEEVFEENEEQDDGVEGWEPFLESLSQEEDLVLVSVFKEADVVNFDIKTKTLHVAFLKKFMVFEDIVQEKKDIWKKHFYSFFADNITLQYTFSKQDALRQKQQAKSVEVKSVPSQQQEKNLVQVKKTAPQKVGQYAATGYSKQYGHKKYKTIDVSDTSQWKTAYILQKHFQGTFVDVTGDNYS